MNVSRVILSFFTFLAMPPLAYCDGQPDTAFGANGKYVYAQYVPGAPQGSTSGDAMKVLADGRILVAGATRMGTGSAAQDDFFVMRLKADASGLDTSFGTHAGWSSLGCDAPSAPTNDVVKTVVLGSAGDFFLVGTSTDTTTFKESLCIAKLDGNGNPIAAFNGNGHLVLASPTQNWFASDGLLANGKLLVLGNYYHLDGDPLLLRLDATTGAFEGNFLPSNGSLGTSTYAYAFSADNSGHIVITGQHKTTGGSSPGCFVMRRMADLSADTTFNGGAPLDIPTPVSGVTNPYAVCSAILIQPDGKIVVDGYARSDNESSPGSRVVVIRLMDTGTLDSTFNAGAPRFTYFETSVAGAENYANALSRQTDGKLLLVGYGTVAAGSNRGKYDFGIIRLLADGSYDSSFTASTPGSNLATVMLDFGLGSTTTGYEAANAVALQAGKIVVAGRVDADTSGTLLAPALSRLVVDLIFSDTFGI